MKKNVRRALSAVALSSLALSMIACQAGPQLGGPQVAGPNIVRGASTGSRDLSPAEAKLAQAVAQGLNHVPGEFIVKMKPGATPQAITAQGGIGTMSLQSQPVGSTQTGLVLMKAPVGAFNAASEEQTLNALRNNPAVLYAEPNYIVQLNDPKDVLPPEQPQAPSNTAPNDPEEMADVPERKTEAELTS